MNRSVFSREILPFLGFLILTVVMTWPWALYLRDAVAGPGDPYAIAYWLWWGYHQTFHDPLNLFNNIFEVGADASVDFGSQKGLAVDEDFH